MLNIIYAHCKTENNMFDGYVRPPLFRQSKYCKCLAAISKFSGLSLSPNNNLQSSHDICDIDL